MQQNRPSRVASMRPRSHAIDGLVGLCLIFLICSIAGVPGLALGRRVLSVILVAAGYLSTCFIVRTLDADEGSGAKTTLLMLWQRLRHVWPSLFFVTALVTAICGPLNVALLAAMRADVIPTLGFFANWANLTSNASPNNSVSPLAHMWFVSVEMQLFVLWLFVVFLVQKAGKVWARRLTMIFAALSALWLVLQCVTGGNLMRVSLATDTQLCSYLFGAWLAFAFPYGRVPNVGKKLLLQPMNTKTSHMRRRRYRATPAANVLGIASLVGIIGITLALPEGGTLLTGISMLCISLLSVTLIASLLTPGNVLGRALSLAPLSWLGSRALGVYLWFYPLLCMFAGGRSNAPWPLAVAAAAVTLAAAELTYRLVELPFSSAATVGRTRQQAAPTYRLATTALIMVIAAVFGVRALTTIPTEAIAASSSSASALSKTGPASTSVRHSAEATRTGEEGSSNASQEVVDQQSSSDANSQSATSAAAESAKGANDAKNTNVTESSVFHASSDETKNGKYDPVLIGDSVPGDADWSRLPDMLLDTYIGRRPDQALEVLRGYVAQDGVGKIVILACFSNVTPSADQLDEFANLLGEDRQIYLVGTVNPDGFMDEANDALKAATERHQNMHYVDWPAVEQGHEKEYLWADATHLRPEGAVMYVDMVMKTIAQDFVAAGGTIES